LFLRNLQPFTPPDTLNTFVIHVPPTVLEQRSDPAVAIATEPSCKVGDVTRQEFMIIRDIRPQALCCPWLSEDPAGFAFRNLEYPTYMIDTLAATRRA
jgi:hypothetical protein